MIGLASILLRRCDSMNPAASSLFGFRCHILRRRRIRQSDTRSYAAPSLLAAGQHTLDELVVRAKLGTLVATRHARLGAGPDQRSAVAHRSNARQDGHADNGGRYLQRKSRCSARTVALTVGSDPRRDVSRLDRFQRPLKMA